MGHPGLYSRRHSDRETESIWFRYFLFYILQVIQLAEEWFSSRTTDSGVGYSLYAMFSVQFFGGVRVNALALFYEDLTAHALLAIPIDNPRAPTLAAGVLCILSIGSSSYLFLQRVRAVYADSKRVRWLFSIFWFIYTVSEITVPLGVEPAFIPGTHYYKDSGIHPVVALSFLIGILFDSSVFLAVSYKIASTHSLSDERIGWDSLVTGKALPRLSRAILQGGQQYYLQVVIFLVSGLY